jgi:hypothetical protein
MQKNSNKLILKTITITSLLAQVFNPMWWSAVIASFYYFWIEGVFEGGGLNFSMTHEGNIFWGLFSIYCIVAIFVSIKSSILIRRADKTDHSKMYDHKIYTLFVVINILTIILSISFVIYNGGIIPRL